MEGTPHRFDQIDYNKVMTAFARQGDHAGVCRMWAAMQQVPWRLRQRDYGVLVSSFCKQGDIEGAQVGPPVLRLRGLPVQDIITTL